LQPDLCVAQTTAPHPFGASSLDVAAAIAARPALVKAKQGKAGQRFWFSSTLSAMIARNW
jgi:hypothetical protein